ncbi:FadR family transcriptional regulator [Mesorhizobium sp. CGMCC 1.15528]|uniref:FadR family transcriptional regulator n=1 Tax=Mesorhizobium zhangyense TaxID=1776730 RepID=A0A7C9VEJ3_9HYPH|nr:FadR/GntR family transcriptional regulator [Mesorhizobium zhangyense]NGN42910.1 FadR family transcriptional regulator [Mesorhizobium zhangyense]
MIGNDILAQVPDLRPSLTRRTARDVIADKLMSLIATGVLAAGDELPGERELATALDVSRETVRGAIQALSARGIVEVSQGSRTRVANIDLTHVPVTIAAPSAIDRYDLNSVHAARLLIELKVVGDAADRICEADLARLDSSLAAQRVANADPVRFLICDREFHVTVYRACGNPLLADFVTDLYTYMMEHRRYAMARTGAIEESYADHVAIVEALRAHDREAVVLAFKGHLQRIHDTTKEMLEGHVARGEGR